MKWKKVDGCDVLLSEDPKTIQESIIDYIIFLREERKIASTSISTNVAAIRKFYDCNDIRIKMEKNQELCW
jgi:site-specific recombinase XerD